MCHVVIILIFWLYFEKNGDAIYMSLFIFMFILVTHTIMYVFVIFQESVLNGRMEPLGTVEVMLFNLVVWVNT